MQDATYEAKEAAKILDMPTTTFYREVEAGNIPFILEPGKKRGMRFPKEAIHLHAHMQKKAKKKTVHHAFTRSTNADIWTAIENARRIYGEDDIIPYRKVLEWREINDEMSMTIKEDGRFVGCTTFIPLEERVIQALLHDKIRERNIPTSAIKKWTDPHLSVYIASVSIEQSGDTDLDRERGLFLLRHTIKWAVTLTQQYDIKNWYAIGATEVGQTMLERLGFKEVVSLEEGARKGYLLKDMHHPSKLLNKFLTEMEEEEVDLSTHHTAAKFVKATVEEMPEAVALAAEVFGGLNTIPAEKRTAWLRKNPDIDYLLK